MMKSVCVVLFILISGFIVSCTNVPGETPVSKDPTISSNQVSVSVTDPNDIKNAVIVLQQYSDTATIAWMNWNEENENKMNHISQLVSQFNGKGPEVEQLKRLLREVKSNSLTQTSQYNNASVHHYEVLSDSLTIKTVRLYSSLKSARKAKPAMTNLVKSIQKEEAELKVRKEEYNEAAKKYNDFFWEKRTLVLQARGELPTRPVRTCFRNKA